MKYDYKHQSQVSHTTDFYVNEVGKLTNQHYGFVVIGTNMITKLISQPPNFYKCPIVSCLSLKTTKQCTVPPRLSLLQIVIWNRQVMKPFKTRAGVLYLDNLF